MFAHFSIISPLPIQSLPRGLEEGAGLEQERERDLIGVLPFVAQEEEQSLQADQPVQNP